MLTDSQKVFAGIGGFLVLVGLTYTGASFGRARGRPPDVAATPAGRAALVVGGLALAALGLLGWIR